jgi:hypothetical protein
MRTKNPINKSRPKQKACCVLSFVVLSMKVVGPGVDWFDCH